MLQSVDDGWAVGLVLDKDAGRSSREFLPATLRHGFDHGAGLGKGPAPAHLVEQIEVCALPAPELTHHEVAGRAVLERHIP